jgi:predicted ester cyclase
MERLILGGLNMKIDTNANTAVIRRQYEALNQRNIEGALADVADDLVNHGAVPETQGAAGLRRIFEKLLLAFPDHACICEDTIAEGDRIASRLRVSGTNTGPLTFLHVPLPATGRRFESVHIHMARLVGGKIVERWSARDDIGMLRQLGIFLPGNKQ